MATPQLTLPTVDVSQLTPALPNSPLPYIPQNFTLPNPVIPTMPTAWKVLASIKLPAVPSYPPVPALPPIPGISIPKPYSLNLSAQVPSPTITATMIKTTLKANIPSMIANARVNAGLPPVGIPSTANASILPPINVTSNSVTVQTSTTSSFSIPTVTV